VAKALYYGDNLDVLKGLPDEWVDLVYLDPPFNSNADYNVLFREHSGSLSQAQISAFEDTWQWGPESAKAVDELLKTRGDLGAFLDFTVRRLGHNALSAYLVMMAIRLVELHRVLKSTGTLYLHCDPTASHYLKAILDLIFDPANFRNEITWKRSDAHNDAKHQFPRLADRILLYAKSDQAFFQPQHSGFPEKTLRDWYLYLELPDGSVRRMTKEERHSQVIPKGARRFNAGDLRSPNPRPNLTYDYKGYRPHKNGWAVSREKMEELDAAGLLLFPSNPGGRIMRKRYLDESVGPTVGDVWTDIPQIRGHDAERLGYPTQKPVALLERIINASSRLGDTVLDPFCGCGTAVDAAEKLGREWVGIDITYLAVNLIQARLRRDQGLQSGKDYVLEGTPTDLAGAHYLFEHGDDGPYQFQFWVLGLIGAQPYGMGATGRGKKGGDTGIDGLMYFRTPGGEKVETAVVSVKGGKRLAPGMVRDLESVVRREKAAIGVFLSLEEPTQGMRQEAAKHGVYHYGDQVLDRIQIITVAELFAGKRPMVPIGALNVSLEQRDVMTVKRDKRSKVMKPLFGDSAGGSD
jgi:site-specific DNA-methyltransferase (adenine-specific)